MTQEQRTAMARIISDMIKADNIIEESEIMAMKQLMSKYELTLNDMSNARRIRFSEAVTILQGLPQRVRKDFFDSIYSVALSDTVCLAKEALLLLALQYCLVDHTRKDADGNVLPKPYLISCPNGESSLNDQYMVYLESTYDNVRNEEIQRDFELLVSMSKLNGFNFVYIPKMVEEFKEMDSEYVKDVISYMAPQLEGSVVTSVYNRLCGLTTVDFFHNVLYEKLKVKAVYDAKPSILINIGTSVVPYCATDGSVQYYTEFLCVPITSGVLRLVRELLDFYNNKVSIRTVTISDNRGQFKYFGFYKALFDFLIAPPPVAPDLIFLGQDIKNDRYRIAFRFEAGRERTIYLTPKRYNLYLAIAKSSSIKGGGVPVAQVDRTSLSHIKRLIMDSLQDVSFVDQYIPERVGNLFKLRLESEKIFVRSMSGETKLINDIESY